VPRVHLTRLSTPRAKHSTPFVQVNITLEIMLGLEDKAPPTAPDDHAAKPRTLTLHGHPDEGAAAARRLNLRRLGVVIERCAFTLLSVAVSVLVPGFSAMMAFIGSFSAFLLCVIGALSIGAPRWARPTR
jgi:solute carrier family 32 (vesicular inhibitory amino acid transporter)